MAKTIILAGCVDRHLSVTPFPTREEAWEQMRRELIASDVDMPELYEKDKDKDGLVSSDSSSREYEITKEYAWFTDTTYDIYNDWQIFEVEI